MQTKSYTLKLSALFCRVSAAESPDHYEILDIMTPFSAGRDNNGAGTVGQPGKWQTSSIRWPDNDV